MKTKITSNLSATERLIIKMKTFLIPILLLVVGNVISWGQTSPQTFSATGTWTCPAGVTSVQVECWGAGGAGGSAKGTSTLRAAAGGGAGGAYAKSTISVTAGVTYTVTVGTGGITSLTNGTASAGGDSWFSTNSTILAKGGAGANSLVCSTAELTSSGGAGTTVGSIGSQLYKGGSGASGSTPSGAGFAGGGGSSAGTLSDGNSSANSVAGVAVTGGGIGGTGRASNGGNGSAPASGVGGGGGGAWAAASTTQRSGGSGANGQVILTWSTPTPVISTTGTLVAVNTTYGTASASPTSFSVSGANMTAGILVTPPAGYQVCLTSTGTYTSTLTVSGTGTIAATTVYVRLSSTATVASSPYSGNIALSSSGATGVNVATASSTVTAKALTISGLTANNKLYDGNTSATLSGTAALVGVVNSDVVTLGGTPVATFASSAAGTGIAVTVTGYSISGAGSGNYTLTQPTGLTASITSSPTPVISSTLTASGTYGTVASTYTITASESPTSFNATGLPAGLSINTTNGQITGTPTAVPGNFNVTISATNEGGTGNATLVYTIAAKTLTIAGAAVTTKNYDASTAATITGTLATIYGSDIVTFSSGTSAFASANAGSLITVTANCTLTGTAAGYYTLTQPTGLTGTINAVAPGAPTINSISSASQSLAINYTAGTTGGTAITDYKYSTDNGVTFKSAGTTTNPFTITTVSTDANPLINGTSYNIQIKAVNTAGDGTASTTTAATPNLSNDLCANAFTITQDGVANNGTSVGRTYTTLSNETYTYASDVWYTFTSTYSGSYTLTTSNGSQYLDLYVFTGATCPSDALAATSVSNGAASLTSSNTLSFTVVSGTTYLIRVAYYATGSTASAFTISLGKTPATVYTWTGASSTWLAANWDVTGYPQTGTHLAYFNNNTNVSTGINMNTLVGALTIGGFQFGTGATTARTINNSSTTASGILTLAGVTQNSIDNVIIRNQSTGNHTIANGTSQALNIALGNATNIVNVEGTGNIVISSAISGSGKNLTLNANSSGDLRLSGVNSYDGGTTVNGGTAGGRLRVDAVSALPTTGAIAVNTGGRITLNVAGTYGGASQSLTFNPNQTANPSLDILSGAAVVWQGTTAINAETRIEASGATGSLTLAGVVSGAGTLNKQAAGNLILSNTGNTLTGATQVRNGTLTVNAGSKMGTGALTMYQTSTNNTALALNENQTVSALSSNFVATTGTQTQVITIASGKSLTVDQSTNTTYGAGSVSTLSSTIEGAGGLTKSGSGTLTFTSPNTYTGATSVTAGSLVITRTSSVTYTATITTSGVSVVFAAAPADGDYTILTGALSSTATLGTVTGLSTGQVASFNASTGVLKIITPSITGAATATAFTTTYGTASTPQTFSVSGAGLTANLVATAPTGFEVSADGTNYGATATFTQSAGSASGSLRIRLAATATVSGSYNAQNIALTSTGATTVNITTATSGNTVSAKGLTITGLTASNKPYDGTTVASLSGTPAYSGLVNSESFSVSGTATATFASSNVGTAIAVTIGGFTAPSTNYTITQPSASANISAVALTITGVSANNKTYDRTTAATLSGTAAYSGLVNGEVYAVTGTPTATFTSANVANGITVAIAGYTAPANYTLTQPSATANITAKNLTIDNATAQNKTFDGTTTATITGSLAGVIAPDVVTLTLSGTFATSTAGTGIAVTSTSSIGGAAVANYALTQPTGLTADISAYPLPVITSSLSASESYGATAATYTITASNSPTSFNAIGLPAGLSINTSTGAITGTPTATPGNYNVTISATNIGGTGAAILVYTITPKILTLTPATADATKVYDGTIAATVSGASISGVIGTDSVSVSANGTFADKNIGTAKTITINYSLNGTDAAKYTLASNSSTSSGNITALGISTTGATAQHKTYDNTTAATISGTALVGVLNGDVVTISTSGTFAQATIGTGIVVTSTQTLGGADAGNYTVSLPTGLTANISSVALTVSEASAANKAYDASTTASISGAVLNGVVAGDTVNLLTTATFDNKNVGTGKIVTIAYSLNGADAAKYTLATTSSTTTANISALGLTIAGASVTAKTYDGNTTATFTGGTLNGILSGDLVTFSGTAAYSDANAGIGKTVTTALVLSGADAINYTLTQPSLTGDINKANQTITFGALAQKYTTDADFNLTATSLTSGTNAITYSSANSAVATVTLAGLVDVLTAGSTTITASQAASTNYNAATASQSLVVVVPSFTAGRLVVARVGTGTTLSSAATALFLDEYTTTGTTGISFALPTTTVGNVNRVLGSGTATSDAQLNLSTDGQYLTMGGYDASAGTATVATTGSNNRVISRINNLGKVETTVLPGTSFYVNNNFRSVTTVDGSRYWTGGTGGTTGVATVVHQGNTTPTTAATVFNTITNIRTVAIYNGQLYYSTGSGTNGVYSVGSGLPTTTSTSTGTFLLTNPYAFYILNRGSNNFNCYVVAADATGPVYKFSSIDNGATWTARGSIAAGAAAYGIVAQVNGSTVDLFVTTTASSVSTIVKITDTAAFNATIAGTPSTIATAPTNTAFRGIAFAPVLITPVVTNTTLTASGTVDTLFTNYTITAVNSPETFNATGLPTGLAINTATGVISGTPTAGGTFNVTISATNGAGTSATKTLVITIAKANQVITFNTLAGKDITDQDFTLSATSTSSANPIVYTSSDASIATISGNTVHIVGNTGNVTITASQVGNANYNVAVSVDQILTVSNASAVNQTITFDPLVSVSYGDAPFSLSATSDSGLAVTFTSSNPAVATVSGTTVTIVGTGTTNITASQGGNNNVNPAPNVIRPLVINKKQLTIINAIVTTKTYDGTNVAAVTGGTLNGIVGSDDVTLGANPVATFTDVNVNTNIPVTATYTLNGAAVAKYTLLQPSLTGTISKANQLIVFTTVQPKTTFDLDAALSSFSVTSATNTITYTSSDPSVLSILNPSAGVYNLHVVGEGFATITASQAGSSNYNAAPDVNQTIIVKKVLYRNQFEGVSACPTNGNTAFTATNTTGTAVSRSTITCNPTGNVLNSTTLNATASVSNTSYLEFALTSAAGYVMNLASVSFFRQASNTAPNQLEVRYSTDGFATSTSWGAAPLTPKTDFGSIATWDFADFTTAIAGTVTFRIYPYGTQRADLAGTSSSTGTFRIDDVTIFGTIEPTPSTIWDGSVWSNGVPNLSKNAVIDAAYSTTANGVFTANALTVNANYGITVNTGHNLTITNEVINNGTFVLENNANLIQTNNVANTGNITIKRDAKMRRLEYTYWSAPVANQNLLAFSPNTLSNRFYTYNEPTNAFVAVTSPSTATFGDSQNQIAGKGFMIRAPNTFLDAPAAPQTFTGIFTGVPNNGTYTTPVSNSGTNKGYNLIGNPYPSPIDANKFLAANPGTLYFWTHASFGAGANNYASYTDAGSTAAASNGVACNGTIQTGQGFLILTTSNGNATFTNAMRVGNNAGQFFRTATKEKHRIWLNLNSATTAFNQIMVGYMEDATQGVDTSIDGPLLAYGSSTLSSRIYNTDYVIQGRALPFATADSVPLGFNAAAAGEFTISIDHVDGLFLGSQEVYLRDNLLGTTSALKDSPYTFTSASGVFNSRFEIVYTSSPLGTHNPTFDAESVVVYQQEQVLHVNSGTTVMAKVRVFDVRGRLLFEKNNINATAVQLTDLKAEQQVLLVQITSDDNRIVTKKVVF